MATVLDNPFFMYGIIAGGLAFAIYLVIKNKNKIPEMKEFIPTKSEKTIENELKEKLKIHGNKINGFLFSNIKRIGRIDSYLKAYGEFEIYTNSDGKNYKIIKDEKKPFNLIILRMKNTNILLRLFGLKKIFYVLKMKNNEGEDLIKIDKETNRFFISDKTDLISYGNVWLNSDESMEYLNDISMKRMLINTNTHLENLPDKIVHMEMEQAKKERLNRVLTEQERMKWEERKSAGDTTIA